MKGFSIGLYACYHTCFGQYWSLVPFSFIRFLNVAGFKDNILPQYSFYVSI